MARMEEVIIVGAGPTGLTLAAELRRLGISAMLFDREMAEAQTSRAIAVHARTLEVLEPLGVAERMIAEGLVVRSGRLRSQGGEILASLSFEGLPTKYPFVLSLPQDRTEAVLREALRKLGGAIFRPVEITALTQVPDHVTVTYTAAGVLVQELCGRWVVGCDGLHSVVRDAAGIGFDGGAYQESFLLADVAMDWPLSSEGTPAALEIFLGDGHVTLVAPLPGGVWRMVATVDAPPAKPGLEDCQRILDERTVAGARVRSVAWSSRFHIQHRVARRLRQGRVLIAGDAAHVHSPAGGQGMNTGIQDAVSLAGALEKAIRSGDESGLAQWENERLKIAHSVVTTTDRMTRLATASNPVAQTLRNAALGLLGHIPALEEAVARRLSGIDNR